MVRLVIIGAGGFGREVLLWARDIQEKKTLWDEIVFIDDDLNSLQGFNISNEIISTINDYVPQKNDFLICAIGNTKVKKNICEKLSDRGGNFTSFIHPTAIVSENIKIGKGIMLGPFSIVSDNVEIGDFFTLNSYSVVGHDAVIKNYVTINAHCNVMGNTSLDDGVFLGGSAAIIPNVKIQENATIGAGSVVIRKVKKGTTVFGNPAIQIN